MNGPRPIRCTLAAGHRFHRTADPHFPWVVLGPLDPNRADPDDYTRPTVSPRFSSKLGVQTWAIDNGLAVRP